MKLIPNDLLDETRIVYPRNQITTPSASVDYNTMARGVYVSDAHQQKKYSEEDVDKIVTMLTLFIDDPKTQIQVEEVYQSWKETGKI